MSIEAVIFDIGDVLEVNPRSGWSERWAKRLLMDVASFERRLDEIWAPGALGNSSLDELERHTAAALGLDDAALTKLMGEAWSEYVGSINHELADYFVRLSPRYKTAILSNSSVGAREREQEAHRLGDMCDVIVYSHEEGYLKPDPRIYRVVCDRLGVAPQAAVLLDDVQANVDGAHAVGMRGITFTDNTQAIAELQRLLIPRHPSLRPDSGATHRRRHLLGRTGVRPASTEPALGQESRFVAQAHRSFNATTRDRSH